MRFWPLLLLVPSVALSATTDTGLHYDNVEFQYINIDIDDIDVDADGFAFSASRLITENVFLAVAFAPSIETDTFTINGFSGTLEERDILVNVGARTPIADNADFFGAVGFLNADVDGTGDFEGFSDSDTGLTLDAGIKVLAAPSLEVTAGLSYVDIFDDTTTSFNASGFIYLNESFALGLGFSTSDDATSYTIGGRYSY